MSIAITSGPAFNMAANTDCPQAFNMAAIASGGARRRRRCTGLVLGLAYSAETLNALAAVRGPAEEKGWGGAFHP